MATSMACHQCPFVYLARHELEGGVIVVVPDVSNISLLFYYSSAVTTICVTDFALIAGISVARCRVPRPAHSFP